MEICKGDIICLLEDYDEFHELKMSTIADVYEKDPDIDVFVNGYEIVDSEGKLVDVNYFKRNREFQSTQPLLKLNNKNYDPKLFDLLNFYFNNSRFSYNKKVIQLLIPIFDIILYSIDVIMPDIWIGMNFTVSFIPNINNKFMIREYTHRLKKMLNSNSENGFQDAITRDIIILEDYASLNEYLQKFDSQLANFVSLMSKFLQIRIDIMKADKRKLFIDLKDFSKLLLQRNDEKYKPFLKRITLSFMIISSLYPLFLINPKLARRITTRVLG